MVSTANYLARKCECLAASAPTYQPRLLCEPLLARAQTGTALAIGGGLNCTIFCASYELRKCVRRKGVGVQYFWVEWGNWGDRGGGSALPCCVGLCVVRARAGLMHLCGAVLCGCHLTPSPYPLSLNADFSLPAPHTCHADGVRSAMPGA